MFDNVEKNVSTCFRGSMETVTSVQALSNR